MDSVWYLSLGCGLTGLAMGAVLGRSAVHALRLARVEDSRRWWVLRDALQALPQLSEDEAKLHAVQMAVAQGTGFRAHLLRVDQGQVADDQMAAAPFFVEPHLVGMAMRQRQRISSAALAPLGWACAYIPLCAGAQVRGVLALARPEHAPWRPEELACCDILAQGLAACLGAGTATRG